MLQSYLYTFPVTSAFKIKHEPGPGARGPTARRLVQPARADVSNGPLVYKLLMIFLPPLSFWTGGRMSPCLPCLRGSVLLKQIAIYSSAVCPSRLPLTT